MRKPLLLLLLFASLSLAAGYGESWVRIERVWTVDGGGNYSFEGTLAVNNSNQRVVEIITDPPMEIVQGPEGNLKVRHNGSEKTLRAIAIVAIKFDTNLTSDPPLQWQSLGSTNYTAWDEAMEEEAEGLAENGSSLNTTRNLANFVHDYVEYNISYFGLVRPAQEVFAGRQGVCVEYSHLLIAMARSLGLDTRFVSGYVNGGVWQPHAWVEIVVPGYGPLSVDPTFGEAGELDGSHAAVGTGEDQASIYDRIESVGGLNLSVTDSAEFINESYDPRGLGVAYSFDDSTGALRMLLMNRRQEYVFGTYELTLPEKFGMNERKVLLFGPGEVKRLTYMFNMSDFTPGYRYTVPLTASLGDSVLSELLTVEVAPPAQPPVQAEPSCLSGTILVALPAAALLFFLWQPRRLRKRPRRANR